MDNIIIPNGFKRVKDICPICHNQFRRTGEWRYKTRSRYKNQKYFCSYKCFREYEKKQQEKFENKYADDFKGVSK